MKAFGKASIQFAVLCTQHRCSLVEGETSLTAAQKPSAPSPTASTGAARPRSRSRRRRAAQDSLGSAVAVREGHQFLGAVGTDTDDDQAAQPVLFQADVEVHPPSAHQYT